MVEHLVSNGVADLVVGGEGPGRAWVDAVQLEEGPRASEFRTRYPVEAVLAGRRQPPMVHPGGSSRWSWFWPDTTAVAPPGTRN